MPIANSGKAYGLLGFESTFGVKASGSIYKIHILESNINGSREYEDDETKNGSVEVNEKIEGVMKVSGNIKALLRTDEIGIFLKGILGVPVTTGTGPYVHTYKPAMTIPSFTFQHVFPDVNINNTYLGLKMKKISFKTDKGGKVDVDIEVVGANVVRSDNILSASPTELPVTIFNNKSVSKLKENGVDLASIIQTGLTIEREIDDSDDNYTMGSGGIITQLSEGKIKIADNVKLWFTDASLIQKAENSTETSLEFGWDDGINSINIKLPEIKFQDKDPEIQSGSKGISYEIPYFAYYNDNADGASIVVTLTNGQENYN